MEAATKDKLMEIWKYCDDNCYSTYDMLKYMSEKTGLNMDRVIEFVLKN
jgi:predicted nucleic acid-binding Zn ribbon protein